MKKAFFSFALCLPLILSSSFVFGQYVLEQDPPDKRAAGPYVRELGFSIGVGTNALALGNINQLLHQLEIGQLDNVLVDRTFSFHMTPSKSFKVSGDISLGDGLENRVYNRNTTLHLSSTTMSVTGYRPLWDKNKWQIAAVGGLRSTTLHFDYNAAAGSSSNINQLLNSPTGTATGVRLTNKSGGGSAGASFQYRLNERQPGRLDEYRVSIDTGYSFYFTPMEWREAGSRVLVADMPDFRPDNFYFKVTMAVYLNLKNIN